MQAQTPLDACSDTDSSSSSSTGSSGRKNLFGGIKQAIMVCVGG
jgi:hypothetical protein